LPAADDQVPVAVKALKQVDDPVVPDQRQHQAADGKDGEHGQVTPGRLDADPVPELLLPGGQHADDPAGHKDERVNPGGPDKVGRDGSGQEQRDRHRVGHNLAPDPESGHHDEPNGHRPDETKPLLGEIQASHELAEKREQRHHHQYWQRPDQHCQKRQARSADLVPDCHDGLGAARARQDARQGDQFDQLLFRQVFFLAHHLVSEHAVMRFRASIRAQRANQHIFEKGPPADLSVFVCPG